MASGRPRTRSAGQLLHPTAGYGVHPGDTIAVSYDVSRTELWTGTCTGDDHTGLRITWEPPTPWRQHDRPLTADDLANATVVQTAEQAAAAQAQPAVCDYEQQRNAAVGAHHHPQPPCWHYHPRPPCWESSSNTTVTPTSAEHRRTRTDDLPTKGL